MTLFIQGDIPSILIYAFAKSKPFLVTLNLPGQPDPTKGGLANGALVWILLRCPFGKIEHTTMFSVDDVAEVRLKNKFSPNFSRPKLGMVSSAIIKLGPR